MDKRQNASAGLYRLAGRLCRKVLPILICFTLLVSAVGTMQAQDDRPPVITAENVGQLESVAQIDFTTMEMQGSAIENGRFALRADGERIALTDTEGAIHVLDVYGLVVGSYGFSGTDGLSAAPHEIAFGPDHVIASIHTDGSRFYVAEFDYETGPFEETLFNDLLLDVWWAESSLVVETGDAIRAVAGEALEMLSQTFKEDTESIIRIGRIEPPLAVTVTEDGRVKRWNMETGEITAEVQVERALPIYGQVNAGGDRYLVWRDPLSEALHLLDFETGADRVVVELDGTYIPFIFLAAAADVMIGVNVDDRPVVVAWHTETGEQYDLGEYRECNRPPDMVRLSVDGTTLVIGCDTGLDVWRISGR